MAGVNSPFPKFGAVGKLSENVSDDIWGRGARRASLLSQLYRVYTGYLDLSSLSIAADIVRSVARADRRPTVALQLQLAREQCRLLAWPIFLFFTFYVECSCGIFYNLVFSLLFRFRRELITVL